MRAARLALALLAGCGVAPEPQEIAVALAPNVPSYVAARGAVMVIAPGPAVEAADPGYVALSYLGLRSPTEAVFVRQKLDALPGSVRATSIPNVYVPIRSGAPAEDADFIAPRGAAGQPDGAVEIVLKPALGAVFGVDDLMLLVTEVSPGRVAYQLDGFDLLGALQ